MNLGKEIKELRDIVLKSIPSREKKAETRKKTIEELEEENRKLRYNYFMVSAKVLLFNEDLEKNIGNLCQVSENMVTQSHANDHYYKASMSRYLATKLIVRAEMLYKKEK